MPVGYSGEVALEHQLLPPQAHALLIFFFCYIPISSLLVLLLSIVPPCAAKRSRVSPESESPSGGPRQRSDSPEICDADESTERLRG